MKLAGLPNKLFQDHFVSFTDLQKCEKPSMTQLALGVQNPNMHLSVLECTSTSMHVTYFARACCETAWSSHSSTGTPCHPQKFAPKTRHSSQRLIDPFGLVSSVCNCILLLSIWEKHTHKIRHQLFFYTYIKVSLRKSSC